MEDHANKGCVQISLYIVSNVVLQQVSLSLLCQLHTIMKRLRLDPSPTCKVLLQQKDLQRIEKADYKASEHYNKYKKTARAERKGFEDKMRKKKELCTVTGALDIPDTQPGPSKRPKNN